MTTDITELAQSLKAAAEKATQGNWRAFKYHDGRCGIGGGHHDEIMVCEHISKRRPHDAEFIALANPANVLALVEALEKAQLVDDELCKLLPPGVEYMDPPDGGSVTPLEQVSRMVADYRQRIDGLEASHTKLRESMAAIHNTIRLDGASTSLGVIMNAAKRAYEESTSAAGIKWEAE